MDASALASATVAPETELVTLGGRIDNLGTRAAGDPHYVSHVVFMSVRNQDVVGRNCVHVDVFGQFVRTYERVKQQGLATSLHCKTGMSVKGNFHIRICITGIICGNLQK